MIKKLITIFALSWCAIYVNAAVIDTTGLTDAQVAEIKAQAAKTAESNRQSKDEPAVTITNISGWGKQAAEAAEGFGKAFTLAARELGITANEFLATDAGKLTAAIIIWKVVGGSLLKLFFLLILWIFGITCIRAMYLKIFTSGYEKIEYSYFSGLFKGSKRIRIMKTFRDLYDSEWIALIFLVFVSFLIIGITGSILT